ncbi:hypothetical protein [Maribacter sp. 2-571]|uniref:hypothetical protein n=1 Tax=Maribacter sp. 2-571 TaxID=3417569 RepID=UPI003D34ECFA
MKVIVAILFAFLALYAFVFLRYRLSYTRKAAGAAEVRYNLIDLGYLHLLRHAFETLLGNKRVFLKVPFKDHLFIYVNKKDWQKLWPESPLKMKEQGYTVVFQFEATYLVFGGLGLAEVVSHKQVKDEPKVLK